MKARDQKTLGFARNLHAAVRKKEIDDRIDLDDAGFQKIVGSLVKQRQESIAQFKKGGRDDLVANEEAELAFLMSFMPQQLSEDEVRKIVEDAISEAQVSSQKDLGKVMKIVVPKTQGRADGKFVSQLVREKIQERVES